MNFTVPGYSVYERLGTGARSTIWLVVSQTTGQQFALKRVIRRGPQDDRFIEQAAQRLRRILAGQPPDPARSFELRRLRRFIMIRGIQMIMEMVVGRTLEQTGAPPLPILLGMFVQVAQGIDALAPAQGYVHTDLKPNNIMIVESGEVKGHRLRSDCPIGHVRSADQGTPGLHRPRAGGEGVPLTQRTDVFNLGATLYLGGSPGGTIRR
ncbi:MAG: hypothetical protein M5U12_22080 [Verrucomicrobia bacterium]|nr:hypothetical protein [Verrucomicrobiota bacterium]